MSRPGPAIAAVILCLAAPLACLAGTARAQEAQAGGGDVAERLSRIEQAMWSGDSGAAAFLREWAAGDANDRVRERSVGALAVLGDSKAADLFVGRLSKDPSARVRRAAAEAIGVLALRVPPWELSGPLGKDPDPLVRAEAARAIGATGLRECRAALIAGLAADRSPATGPLPLETHLPYARSTARSSEIDQGTVADDPTGAWPSLPRLEFRAPQSTFAVLRIRGLPVKVDARTPWEISRP